MSAHDSTPIRKAGTSRIPVLMTLIALLFGPLTWGGGASAQENGRPLVIEDFYAVRTIASPVISPDGEWVAYSVVSRVEEDNSSSIEVWVVATDGDPAPRRISPAGVQASDPSWEPDGLLRYVSGDNAFAVAPDSRPGSRHALRSDALTAITSPDGSMVASLVAASVPKVEPVYASDFERRHEERFDGRAWDWMYFQRDRRPLPTIDPTDPAATPPLEVTISDGSGSPERVLTGLVSGLPILHTCGHRKLHTWRFDLAGGRVGM